MKDKICIVTGANSGIGFVAARELAAKGAKLVMICRDCEKGEKAKEEIMLASGNDHVDLLLCDFSSQSQIREVVASFCSKYTHLDVLLNNAGFLAGTDREITEDGLEKTFAVNHLGYFLLTNLLLDSLRAAQGARVVSVASEAHRFIGRINWDDLQLEEGYSSMKAYALSKLCNIMFAYELSFRLKDTSVTSNSLHPGAIASNFGSTSGGIFTVLLKFLRPMLLSNEKGARTSLYLCSSPEVADVSGGYFDKCKLKRPAKIATDRKLTQRLWQISEELTTIKS